MSKSPSTPVVIRSFRPGDTPVFRRLNEAWIKRYFQLEAKDESAFEDPQASIIDRGGAILLATVDGEPVGCCALLRMSVDQYEVAKMAVDEVHQGKRVGRTMLAAVIDLARQRGARRLYLETNRLLQPAIALYRSLGFQELDPAKVVPSPYARADVYMELWL